MLVIASQNTDIEVIDTDNAILLDWTNIETVTGLSILVQNTNIDPNGPSIVDTIIDTSNDGGVTFTAASQDFRQPISACGSATFFLNITGTFVRIRVMADAGGTTTAQGYLLAQSSKLNICTLDDVKQRLGIDKPDYDTVLNGMIASIEPMFNKETRRFLIQTASDVTEYYTASGNMLQLMRYPIISVTSLKQSVKYDFAMTPALIANTDYRIVNSGKNGIIKSIGGYFATTEDSIEFTGRGGYCPVDQTPAAGERALPLDIREAAIIQSTFMFKRKDDPGLSSISAAQGGSVSKFSDMDLLPLVKRMLNNYVRPQL